jgi:hypothetical protein
MFHTGHNIDIIQCKLAVMSTHSDNFSHYKISLYKTFTVHHEFRSNKPGPRLKIY